MQRRIKNKIEFRTLLQYRIRLFREQQGYTRQAMATILGVLEDTYKKWEIGAGGTMPSYYYAQFCAVTQTSLSDFLTHEMTEDEEHQIYENHQTDVLRVHGSP